MVRKVYGESCGWKCSRIQERTCDFFCESASEPRGKVVSGKHNIYILTSRGTEIATSASLEGYTNLRNIQDLLSDGKTPYERRFGMLFNGPVIPCGPNGHPISAKDISRLHQFGPKISPGIFLGYVLYAVRIWKGNIGRRHCGIGKDGRIWNPCWKTQCKGSVNACEWWKVQIPQSQME